MKKDFQHIIPNNLRQNHMDENVVEKLINNYLRLWSNHKYQLEKIESKGGRFEASVTDAGDIFMDRIFTVDKYTGWVQLAQTG